MSINLIYPPSGFPHDKFREITDAIDKLITELHNIFPEKAKHSNANLYVSWEDKARLKITYLISKYADNNFLNPQLTIGIKDIKETLIIKIENYHTNRILEKIDVFPFINFIDDQLLKIQDKEQQKNPSPEVVQKESQDSFIEIFTVPDWQKYINALTVCEPQLLVMEGNKYKFTGNQKTQRGIVAQYFKFLKLKGIINVSVDRDKIAKVLTTEILDFKIVGSSIDNKSDAYTKIFENQLLEYFNKIN